ncbi:MAG: UDP-N-acetylmuramate dehydrogenase [Clostridia bacterium]|nr:UDP-N-acetylmuramate dehydrogenase [Clostridia bacterium]
MLATEICTFRIGGPIAAVIEPLCLGELLRAIAVCQQEKIPFVVIGRGSNLLFGDGHMELVVIRTVHLNAIRELGKGRLHMLCGTPLPALARYAALKGLKGVSFACGIPGTLGGGIIMNAGAHQSALSDVVEQVTVFDQKNGCIRTLLNHELSFSYRNCKIQPNSAIVLSAVLQLNEGYDTQLLLDEIKTMLGHRKVTQPLDLPSAGSTFRRPTPDYTLSALLDRLGVKGMRVGGAAVSEKHAGFIINIGKATAKDVRSLIENIQIVVEKETGFRPVPEIRFIPEEL